MVLIITSFGATKNYPDQAMMEKTFGMFLGSLRAQTDKDFVVFISHHDHPGERFNEPWIEWRSIAVPGDATFDKALVPAELPQSPRDSVRYEEVCCGGKNKDMGRKTINSAIEAGRWAAKHDVADFWMLRMDSDDLLWNGMVEYLNRVVQPNTEAVYNRKSHMIDARTGRMAVHSYPYSTTCNALRYRIGKDGFLYPNWFYHCRDHTTFAGTSYRDGFHTKEVDFTLCITTNSGNHISNRPPVEQEQYNRMVEAGKPLLERYGLDVFLNCA
jgi:hypothetical protein